MKVKSLLASLIDCMRPLILAAVLSPIRAGITVPVTPPINVSNIASSTLKVSWSSFLPAATIAEVAKAGADTFVAGSAIFGKDDYKQVIQAMRDELGKLGNT